MLNSGLQLYWLKYAKPDIFNKIRWSLHLPQYLSFLFTGILVSDYTSIGCHTMLWNYNKNNYHDWVYAEEIDKILPSIVATNTSINSNYEGKRIKIGIGIHDSSAALLPYLQSDEKPFLLLSTGTWNISLNPYNEEILTENDLTIDCLNYMNVYGNPVKASRLFMGNEYNIQLQKLCNFYEKKNEHHKNIKFNKGMYDTLKANYQQYFAFESIAPNKLGDDKIKLADFENFEMAYHQLMLELMELQCESVERAIGNTKIQRIYIDGGFADNDIYIQLLASYFKNYELRTTKSPLGSSLGAAMIISGKPVNHDFLKTQYAMKKHKSLILSK